VDVVVAFERRKPPRNVKKLAFLTHPFLQACGINGKQGNATKFRYAVLIRVQGKWEQAEQMTDRQHNQPSATV
jgi:hypothetical protein